MTYNLQIVMVSVLWITNIVSSANRYPLAKKNCGPQSNLAAALIPLYNVPNFNQNDPESWQPLLDAKAAYKNVTAWIIGGVPKDYQREKYQAAFTKLLKAGLNVVCYVDTKNATIPMETVKMNIDRCRDFFSTFSKLPNDQTGIFFDNMNSGRTNTNDHRLSVSEIVTYYTTASKYARSNGLLKIFGNPAHYIHEDLVNTVDTFYIIESKNGFQTNESRYKPIYNKSYPKEKFAVLINKVTLNELSHDKVNTPKKWVKYIWVTELYTPGAPTYYRLPSYTMKLFEYLSY